MKNKSKLILASAVFVAALMLLIPLSQTDMSGGGGIGNSDSDSVVLSDNTSDIEVSDYSKLATTIENANPGSTIKLISSGSASSVIKIENKALTLDLNGQTLTLSGLNRIEVGAGGDLTIKDSSDSSVGKIIYTVENDENSAIKVAGIDESNIAKLTLDKCKITVIEKDSKNGYGVYASGYCEIKSGNANASNEDVTINAGYSAISGNGNHPSVTVMINSGTYTSNNSAAVYFPCTGKLTVTGGTFIGKSGFDIRAGTVNISGAEINVTGSYNSIANNSNPTKIDIPTVWGMGIAIIDHASYSTDNAISITLSNLTFSNTNAVCDLYIGDFNQKDGKFDTDKLDQTFTVNKDITVNITNDVLKYTVTKSVNETSGYLIINDLDTSDKSYSVTNVFNKGDATVTNSGTIAVNDPDSLKSAVAIGGNIKLMGDITVKSLLEVKKNTVLNLNGNTISTSINNACLFKIFSNVEMSIIDPSSNSKGTIINTADSNAYPVIQVGEVTGSNGKLTINDGVKINSTAGYGISVITKGTLIIYDAEITTNLSTITGNGLYGDVSIEINNGKFVSNSAAVYFPCTGNLTVTGGTFKGLTGFDIRAGTVSISNATITATGNINEATKFSAANGPSGWGMGIAVFDHSSYAKNSEINVTVTDVEFYCTTCNIFVGKHPGDGKSGEVSFSDVRSFTPNHKINITVNDVDFEEKGLYLNGANDVTIKSCEFNNISERVFTSDSSSVNDLDLYLNAIYLFNCTGNIILGGDDDNDRNEITNISSLIGSPKVGRGIYIDSCKTGSLTIQNNSISNIAYNAIQITNSSFSSISIIDNVIENWDADNDDNANPSASGSPDYSMGRAVRITLQSNTTTVSVSNNTFIKEYTVEKYDNGNILKITGSDTADAVFTDNILVLSGLNDEYDHSKLFITSTNDENKKVVIFNPNGGYFYTSSEPGVMCSIVAGSSMVTEPADPSRSGSYSFADWYDNESAGTIFNFQSEISENKTLYAHWSYTGGSGTPVTPPVEPEPEPIIPDENMNVDISIDEEKTEELIHEAVSSGSESVSIIDSDNVEGDYSAVTVSKSDLETISKKIENNNNINSVSIPTSEGEIIIEKEVLSSILENIEAESIVFEVTDAKDVLTEEQKNAVGDRPVYDINIKAGNENVTSFNGNTITISLPYVLKAGEDSKNIVVYYVKDDGSLEKMNCEYNNGKVIFETDHLSKYVIGYEESEEPVTPDNSDNNKKDDNTVYYISAAVIIILIIIALAYYFMKKKQ